MAGGTSTGARTVRWVVWSAVLVAVGAVTWANHQALAQAVGLMARARVGPLVGAVAAIGLLYLCRASVYGIPLRLLDYTFPRSFLWQTAVIASSLQQLIPAGGAAGYSFLTWALHQRGARGGEASLIALIETLSYAVAAATLVIAALVYLGIAGTLEPGTLAMGFAPGVVVLVIAAWLYVLQRDPDRLARVVLRWQRRLAHLVRRRWPEAPVRTFLEEYAKGKAVIRRHPAAFLRMAGYQYLAVLCDSGALYLTFAALGTRVSPWTVLIGFMVTLAVSAVVSAPAGGGSFEVVMSAFFVEHGMAKPEAIAGAVLFRVVTFWIPLLVSGVLVLTLRRRRTELRRASARRAA